MKDYFGNELQIGDKIVMIEPNYRNFVTGKILKFTPKNIQVEYISSTGYPHNILQQPQQLIKV